MEHKKAIGEKYTPQERFESFTYWKAKLLSLWPWELEKFYIEVHENEDPVIGEITFYIAIYYCYSEHGYFNKYLNDEGHKVSLDAAEGIAKAIRHIWKDDAEKLEQFEKAYKASVESGQLFGWPSVAYKAISPNEELDEMMKARVEQEEQNED